MHIQPRRNITLFLGRLKFFDVNTLLTLHHAPQPLNIALYARRAPRDDHRAYPPNTLKRSQVAAPDAQKHTLDQI